MNIRRVFSNKSVVVFLMAGVFLAGMVSEVLLSGYVGYDEKQKVTGSAMAFEKEVLSLPDAVERVVPAVVYIQSKAIVKRREVESPMMQDPFFRRFFEDYLKRFNIPKEREQQYLGSGVIVDKNGYILTNNHLVQNAKEVEVILPDKRTFDAEIIGTDPRSDVAVLKIEAKSLPVVVLGNSELLRLGQTVLAVGYPYAVGQTVTRGIVSALGRSLDLVDYENFIQTDAAINPGNSGGALINTEGELIGINTAIYSRSGGNQGIGFAIPIELAKNIMDNLIAHGRVIRGYVGVVPQDIDPEMAEFFGLDEPQGVVISHVAEDSPASRAGVEQGDVVTEFGGKKIKDTGEFRRLAAGAEPGSDVTMKILRNGKEKKLKVTMGEHPSNAPSDEDKKIVDKNPIFLGVALETLLDVHREAMNIPSKVKGVLIRQVDMNTPAAKAGLLQGDVIVQVNRKKIEDLDDFREVVESYDDTKALLLIYRNGNYFYTTLKE